MAPVDDDDDSCVPAPPTDVSHENEDSKEVAAKSSDDDKSESLGGKALEDVDEAEEEKVDDYDNVEEDEGEEDDAEELLSPEIEQEKRTLVSELVNIKHDIVALKKFAEKLSSMADESNNKKMIYMLGDMSRRTKNYIKAASKKSKEVEINAKFLSDRVEDVSFQVQEQDLLHTFDVDRFIKRIADLFEWHNDPSKNVRNTFIAPYFPLVQSSGMGKTKLLFEFLRYVDDRVARAKNNKDSRVKKRMARLTAKEQEDRKLEVFDDCSCVTILCSTGVDTPSSSDKEKSQIFLEKLVLPQQRENMKKCDQICRFLDRIFLRCSCTNLVFLFDESQYLLEPHDGFYFRCVRWWLRIKVPFTEKKRVVAVFTGTTSKLTNFYKEPPSSTGSSRDGSKLYHEKGANLYEPFYDLCTIGLFSKIFDSSSLGVSSATSDESDFEKAIPHGRPLFALMQKKGTLTQDKLVNILNRMLLKVTWSDDWTTHLDACLSILGTRIQMGQTAMSIASDMVSKGYAMLSSYSVANDSEKKSSCCAARISFPPDPVCARLAMGMMDEDWVLLSESGREMMKGRSKRFWVETMSLIFTQGLCHPHQGNLGEMGAALYLLFCADLIRKLVHEEVMKATNVDFTTTFSIPLQRWIECMLDANSFYKDTPKAVPVERNSRYEDEQDLLEDVLEDEQDSVEDEQVGMKDEPVFSEDEQDVVVDEQVVAEEWDLPPSKKSNVKSCGLKYAKAEIGFIQVVCNYLRFSIGDMAKQTFLGTLYESGCAVYLYPMCHVVDLLGSIRLTNSKGKLHFVPLLVSVSTIHKKGDQRKALTKMRTLLDNAKTFGLCIRILFAGSGQRVTNMANLLRADDVEMLLQGNIVSKVLVVPRNDPFGIVTNLLETATLGPQECEVYSSHYFLQLQKPDSRLVRSNAKVGLRHYIEGMHEALWNAKAPLVVSAHSAAGPSASARVTRASSAAGATAAASSSSARAPSTARARRASPAAFAPSAASAPRASFAQRTPSSANVQGRKRKRENK